MSKKEEKRDLVPIKNNKLPVPVKKGDLKTPFSLVDKEIYLNSRKDVQAILPDVLGRVLARIWIDPEFRDAIGYMIGDSELHEHTDPSYYGLVHTRFNLYVQLPEEGGYPIYANNLYKLKERTYICCRAGIDKHLCSDVKGNKPRIMISYGFQLPYERVKNIKYNYD